MRRLALEKPQVYAELGRVLVRVGSVDGSVDDVCQRRREEEEEDHKDGSACVSGGSEERNDKSKGKRKKGERRDSPPGK